MRQSTAGQWLNTVIGMALIVGALIGAGWLVLKAIESGETLLGASIAAAGTVGAAAAIRNIERRKQSEAARLEHLGSIYEQMTEVLAGHEKTDRSVAKMMMKFRPKTALYARPAVLAAFRAWLVNLSDPPDRGDMLRYETLVKAMRTDLGMSNWGLAEGDILRAIFPDFDETWPEHPDALHPPEPAGEPLISEQRDGSRHAGGRH